MQSWFKVSFLLLSLILQTASLQASSPQPSPQTIRICAGFTGKNAEAFRLFLDKFEKDSGFKAEVTAKDGYNEAIQSALSPQNGHDIYHISEYGAPMLLIGKMKDRFIPVGQMAPSLNTKKFFARLEIQYSLNGNLWGYPFNPSMGIVYVNKKLYDKARAQAPEKFQSLKPIEDIKTWEEFIQLVSCVKDVLGDEVKGYTHPWNAAYTYEYFTSMAGHFITSERNGFESPFNAQFILENDADLIAYYDRLFEHARKGLYVYVSDDAKTVEQAFAKGNIVAMMQGVGRLNEIKASFKDQKEDFAAIFLPLPYEHSIAKKPLCPKIGGGAFFATTQTEAVKAFLDFISKPENQAYWSRISGYMPSTAEAHALLLNEGFYKKHPQVLVAVQQVLDREAGTFTHIRIGNYGPIRGPIFNKLLEKYLKLEAPQGKEFLKEFDTLANAELKKFNKENKTLYDDVLRLFGLLKSLFS